VRRALKFGVFVDTGFIAFLSNISLYFLRATVQRSKDFVTFKQHYDRHPFPNSRTFPIESLAHNNGNTLVCAEYGYPTGSPNTSS
jgi:hypothetical protein